MELYCKLDLREYHVEIDEYFMTAAFEALEKLVEVCDWNIFVPGDTSLDEGSSYREWHNIFWRRRGGGGVQSSFSQDPGSFMFVPFLISADNRLPRQKG